MGSADRYLLVKLNHLEQTETEKLINKLFLRVTNFPSLFCPQLTNVDASGKAGFAVCYR